MMMKTKNMLTPGQSVGAKKKSSGMRHAAFNQKLCGTAVLALMLALFSGLQTSNATTTTTSPLTSTSAPPSSSTSSSTATSDKSAKSDDQLSPRDRPVEDRLGALDESHPEAYFDLGEDAMDEGKVDIAKHLFVIAASVDENRYGRSACLALAQLARDEHDDGLAYRLNAMALLASTQGRDANFEQELSNIDEFTNLREVAAGRVSSMLGAYRLGEGKTALALLNGDDETENLINSMTDHFPGFAQIVAFCKSYPTCPTCHGARIIKCPQCKGGAIPGNCSLCGNKHFIVCNTCQGHPGDQISDAQIGAMLRFEVTAQDESEATWSMQMDFDHNAPRDMLDMSELPSLYKIDVTATRYVNGKWVKP